MLGCIQEPIGMVWAVLLLKCVEKELLQLQAKLFRTAARPEPT